MSLATIDRTHLGQLVRRERILFADRNPGSRELFVRSRQVLLGGVPMSWMTMWAGGFPLFFQEARGSTLIDVDGHAYVDFCMGDTGAMAGHAPEPTAMRVEQRYRHGSTTMLPTEDSIWLGEELSRRFGLEVWQFSLTATDANRWVLRMARQLTGRPKVLVFNRCYHGTVDETVISLDEQGNPQSGPGNVGPAVDPRLTSKVVEFNDIEALEEALSAGDIACVLTEPALTNVGIVLPEPGFHTALRAATRRTGTLLVIDETQTQCCGPGGYTAAHDLDPDFVTIGKAIAGGIPIGAYGMRRELAHKITVPSVDLGDTGAVGSTLAGNALSMAAARTTLDEVLTDHAFARMISHGERFRTSVHELIQSRHLPWHVTRLGARVEYRFCPNPPRNGGESWASHNAELDNYLHCYLMNRGVLTSPFHNMALMTPATQDGDIDRHTEVLADAMDDLLDAD